MLLPLYVKRKMLNLAKRMAPEDTGNLRFNGIRGKKWSNKSEFTITYDTTIAPYVEILEDSTWKGKAIKRENRHKGFIGSTVLELTVMLNDFYNNKNTPRNAKYFKGNKDYYKNRDRFDDYKINARATRYLRHTGQLELNKIRKEVNGNE